MVDDDTVEAIPRAGMTISVLTRHDVVIMDSDLFLAAARRAYRAENPLVTEDEAIEAVTDVYDAVHALLNHYGSLASDHPDVATGATTVRSMSGGLGVFPPFLGAGEAAGR